MTRQPTPYADGRVPPCSAFLGNVEPIIRDGRLVFRNENRVYFFISVEPAPTPAPPTPELPIGTSPTTERPFFSINLQISLVTFLVGVFINRVQRGLIAYDAGMPIHSHAVANAFIHRLLTNPPRVIVDYAPELSVIISNSNAILPLFTYAIDITPLNFYILFVLNRLERDPGLFFGNNSYVTGDPINFTLAELAICL